MPGQTGEGMRRRPSKLHLLGLLALGCARVAMDTGVPGVPVEAQIELIG